MEFTRKELASQNKELKVEQKKLLAAQKLIKREDKKVEKLKLKTEKDNAKKAAKDAEKCRREAAAHTASKWSSYDMTSGAIQDSESALREALCHRRDLLEDRDRSGHTPLICAAAFGMHQNASTLLDHGANINAQDKNGNTPLISACSRNSLNHITTSRVLLGQGASLDIKNTTHGKTALMYACGAGGDCSSLEMVEDLIKAGARKDIVDFKNLSAMDYAKQKSLPAIVGFLATDVATAGSKRKMVAISSDIE